MPDRNLKPLPIVCSLTGREVSLRKDSTSKVLRRASQVREIEDGYEFTFPGNGELVSGIVEVVVAERECCPFLEFEMHFEAAGGPIRLRVTGPSGTKGFVQEELGLASHTG